MRAFGFIEVPMFKPFLLLDDFRSTNPKHYEKRVDLISKAFTVEKLAGKIREVLYKNQLPDNSIFLVLQKVFKNREKFILNTNKLNLPPPYYVLNIA